MGRTSPQVKRYHDASATSGPTSSRRWPRGAVESPTGSPVCATLVAVGSGTGGVGKSALTLHLTNALRGRGLRVAILDADFNGPSQPRMAGVQNAVFDGCQFDDPRTEIV